MAIKTSTLSLLGAAFIVLGYSTTARAITFVSTEEGKVGTIDPTTGAFTTIANGPGFTDIALAADSVLYGITTDQLYSIDSNSGTTSLIGNLNLGMNLVMNALEFAGNNILYGTAGTTLFKVDLLTGSATFLASIPEFFSSGDLVFDAANNRLLATSDGFSERDNDSLFAINLNDLSSLIIGDIGFKNVFGLSYDEQGQLFGYTSDRKLISINSTTGQGTFVRDITGVNGEVWGATSRPNSDNPEQVPEPTTVFGLIGIGALLNLRLKRKKQLQV